MPQAFEDCVKNGGKVKTVKLDDGRYYHICILNKKIYKGEVKRKKKSEETEHSIEDYEYLLHHIEINDNGEEEIHHCFVYDHIGNMFEQSHLFIKDGKVYLDDEEIKEGLFHVIKGLEQNQEVVWSDEEAGDNKIKPKRMKAGMTLKEKSKEW